MSIDAPRLALVAGEASGDLLAGLLLGGLKACWPQATCFGIGGERMRERGFDAWWPSDKLAVRGYVEVLRHYLEIAGIRRQLATRLLETPPDAFIGVDAPDFNLDLELRLRRAGIKTIQFVCPSIWAWRAGRTSKIAQAVDHVLCLFPFEPALLARSGIDASYVGHPLADAIPLDPPRAASRSSLGYAEDEPLVAVLPGSRRSEIEYNAPAFLLAVAQLHAERPALRFVLPVVPGLRALLEPMAALYAPRVPIQLLDGRSHEALAACDVTLIASGTATLEAALLKRPMVIAYRMHPITFHLMKRMQLQPWVGLPNILSQEFVVPELIQEQAKPSRLAEAVAAWLDDPARRAAVGARFSELHDRLRQDTASKASDAIAKVIAG